jgi:regulator of replication initiation timing
VSGSRSDLTPDRRLNSRPNADHRIAQLDSAHPGDINHIAHPTLKGTLSSTSGEEMYLMNSPTLMNKLMNIEHALHRHDECAVRSLVLEVQESVLALERENEELALENAALRRRLADDRRSSHQPRPHESMSDAPEEAPKPLILADDSPAAPRTPVWHTTHFFFS